MAGIGVRGPAGVTPARRLVGTLPALPQGRGLPAADWERRHRGLLAILWVHVLAVPVFGIAQGYGVGHALAEAAIVLATALVAQFAPTGKRLRSGAVCIGLLSSSGLLVHFSGGYIEFHFHFFVMLALLALYVDWLPFLLAVAYVLAHHGVVGVLDPEAVYNHADAIAHPWKWAGIHAGFVLAAATASVFTWRISEDETQRRVNIERVTEAALATLPLSELLDELLHRVAEVVRADFSTVWLREEDQLVLRSVHGPSQVPPASERHRLSVVGGLHGQIVSTHRPVVEPDVDPAELQHPIHREHGARAVAGVPLIVEGTLVGVLDVASLQPRQFTASDVDLLQLVADRIGPAIDRARLYEQEHRIAATLQQSLLPKRLPDVPGLELIARYLPAGDEVSVGGDWYDVVELSGRRLGLVMGDVAGHGSEAAAFMGQLRTGLRAYATEGHPPEEVVGRLNRLVCGLGDDIMATLLYLELELAECRATLVNAGHPPPALLEADGSCRFLESAHAPPLGAISYARYRPDSVRLDPGATLVLYTDGLVERRRTPLETSLEDLRGRIGGCGGASAATVCATIVESALADGPLADDAAVLAIRRSAAETRTFAVDFPSAPTALPAVRRRVEQFVREAGAGPHECHAVVTSVCEASANAIQHADIGRDASFTISGACVGDRIVLTVRDRGTWRRQSGCGDGGRGIKLMRALIDDVRIDRSIDGTQVTMIHRLGAVSPEGDGRG